jgi:hypothetical protein
MSPDQYYGNSKFKQMADKFTGLATAYPEIAKVTQQFGTDFRGLSIFIGDAGDLVCIVRKFDAAGVPVMLYSSGDDFMEVLYTVEKRLAGDNFRDDKKAMKELNIKRSEPD